MKNVAPAFMAPLTLEQFFAEYWEQQSLHIARPDADSEKLVSFADIEMLLANQPVYYPGIQLTHAGQSINMESYASGQNQILPLRLLEHYANGATIVLAQAHTLFPRLNELCREVMRTMKMRCQTNVYISPPGNQGFNAHYDTHDVFILQVSGSKTFKFYPSPVELPFPDESFDASTLNKADADESITLTAGDTLYIPRGVVHDAVADEHEPSIHVTLGVYPVLLRDVLQEAVQLVAERDIRLRKSLETFSVATSNDASDMLKLAIQTTMAEVLTAVKNPETIQELQGRFGDELSLGALQNCEGMSMRRSTLSSAESVQKSHSFIRLRHDMLIDYECRSDAVKIRTFGQIVEFAPPLSHSVMRLLSSGQLSLDELTDLGGDQRHALIDRLLQENLIELV